MVAHRNEEFRTDAVGRFERQRGEPRRRPDKPSVVDCLLGYGGHVPPDAGETNAGTLRCGADRRLTHTPKHIGPTSGGAGSSENRGILHKNAEKSSPKLEKTLYDGARPYPGLQQTDSTPDGAARVRRFALSRPACACAPNR